MLFRSQLKDLCVAKGARSVSDLARDAMFRLLDDSPNDGGPLDLRDRVFRLDQTVTKLGQKMEAIESRLAAGRRTATWAK